MNACPPREQLRRLLDGDDDGPAVHVETCPACQAVLEELTASPVVARPASDAPRGRLSDDQLHRLRNLLPADRSGNGSLPHHPADWPQVPGYEVLRELGRGGMAVVYEARHLRLNRKVALKMIRAGDLATPERLVRFCAEGEILARLHHPNIVQIYEVGTHDKQPYLALELIPGGSLADALAGRPLLPAAAAALVETLARAMAYAHGQGIVHRDLNPANVLLLVVSGQWSVVSRESALATDHWPLTTVPKVSDFGLAKHLDHDSRLTQTGHVMGTPSYMAPEQVRGRPEQVGPHTDVYALGAILYEALVGRPPFQAPTALEVMNQAVELEPVPPSRLLPGVPRDLEVICLKCLEKDPARRYPTAAALADDLRRFLDGSPIHARRIATVERAWRWARRRPAVAVLLISVAASLLAGTAVSSYFAVKAGQRADDADRARRQSDLRSAELRFRAGLQQCEAGAVDRGLFTLLEAWTSAPADAVAFRRVVRTNLAAWGRQLPVLEYVVQHPDRGRVLARFVGADGEALVTWAFLGRHVVRWDAATGRQLSPPVKVPAGETVVDVNPAGTRISTEVLGRSLVFDLATGKPFGSGFVHRPPGQPQVGGHALFCEPADVVVTKPPDTSHLWPTRRFWRLPPDAGSTATVEPALTAELQPGDAYHVTTAAGGQPVAVVFRRQGPGGTPGRAEFWDLTTGKQLPGLQTPPRITDPQISADGLTILSVNSIEVWGSLPGADGTVRWWETATGRPSGEPWRSRRLAQFAALAGEGQLLVTRGHDDRVRLFDLARGQQRGGDILTAGFPGQATVPRLGVSSDGSRVATTSRDGAVRVWRTRGLLPQTTAAANPRVPTSSLALPVFDTGSLSADGRTGIVRTATDAGVGGLVTTRSAPLRQKHLTHCAVSPDGQLIATAPNNNNFGGRTVVTVWDGTRRAVALNQYRYIHTLAFSPDGQTLAVGCVGGTLLWDVPTGRLRHLLRESSTAADLTFSPDGSRLAVAHINGWPGVGAGVRLWDTASGKPVGEYLAANHMPRARPFFALTFADGGRTLRVFDLIGGRLHALDVETGAARHAALTLQPADEAAFAIEGTLATSHANGSVQQWDATTGQRAGSLLELPHPVARLRYSPDGRVLAVACRDQSVRLWDAASGAPLGPPLLHRADVHDLRFSGDALVTLTATGRTHAWPLPTPVADDPERLELWLQATGGVHLRNDAVALLDPEAWRRCRETLSQRWPEPDPALPGALADADWHDGRARDAEEDGNALAAAWHLDRLIALRPADWRPHARKGLLHDTRGDTELADAAYRLAAKHAPAAALQDWHRRNATACLLQRRWVAAIGHLGRLPADWQAQADRATAFGHLNRLRERDEARARAVELGADAAFLVPLAEEEAARGRWAEAVELFARADGDVSDECHHALCCLKAGDEAEYRRICGWLVADLAADGPTTAAFRRGSVTGLLGLYRVCLLRPDAVADWRPLLQLADDVLAVPMGTLALAQKDVLDRIRRDWLAARGAVLCRLGRHQEAVDSLRLGVTQDRKPSDATARVLLAVALLKLGRKAEAGRCLGPGAATWRDAGFSWEGAEEGLMRPTVAELQAELTP